MPPRPPRHICNNCPHADDTCTNDRADVCEKETRERREERAVAIRPESKTCVAYIGKGYNPNDTTGLGTCVDTFNVLGGLAHCRETIVAGKCPKNRKSPYDNKEVKSNA